MIAKSSTATACVLACVALVAAQDARRPADLNGDRLPDVFVVNLGVDRTQPPERMTAQLETAWREPGGA